MNARIFRAVVGITLFSFLPAALWAQTSEADIASLREKAEGGNAIAQYNLGLIYADSDEPAYDLVEAYVWLSRAGNNGARGRQLNLVAERLNQEQFAEANRRLGEPVAPPRTVTTTAPTSISRAPLETNQAALTELQTERDQLAAELEQLRSQLARAESTAAGTSAELRKRVAIAETALANRDTETNALKAQIAQLQAPGPSPTETALRQERDQLSVEASAAAEELATLRVAAITARQEMGVLNSQLSAQQTQTQSLAEEVDSLTAQLAEVQSSSGDLTAATGRIQNLLAELGEARQQTDLLQARADEYAEALVERTAQEKALQAEVARLAADLNATRVAHATANAALAASNLRLSDLESAQSSFETQQTEVQRLTAEVASLTSQLAAAQSNSGDLNVASRTYSPNSEKPASKPSRPNSRPPTTPTPSPKAPPKPTTCAARSRV